VLEMLNDGGRLVVRTYEDVGFARETWEQAR
jgi:hypothetical protein